jgi:hypothetical protein
VTSASPRLSLAIESQAGRNYIVLRWSGTHHSALSVEVLRPLDEARRARIEKAFALLMSDLE